jgi:hypothetical protein
MLAIGYCPSRRLGTSTILRGGTPPNLAVCLLLAFVLLPGCSSQAGPQSRSLSSSPISPPLTGLPVTITVKQRTTTDIPGSQGRLRLTIDDITRGQVLTSLSAADGASVLAPVSLQPDATASFEFHGRRYELRLKELDNALIGDDFATFILSQPAGPLTEEQKIEKLIGDIEKLQDATFIRNGTEHSAQEAAEHLRLKRRTAGDRIETARQFIDHLATSSSASGEPYQIKFRDGTRVPAGRYLLQRLEKLEGGK